MDVCENLTQEELLFDSFYGEEDDEIDLEPTDYGHLFIDRDNKTIFNLNDFNNIDNTLLVSIKNYEIDTENDKLPEKGLENPIFQHTDNAFLYNLKSNIKFGDLIYITLNPTNKDKNLLIIDIQPSNVEDLIKEALFIYEKYKKDYFNARISFQNNDWKIINSSVNKESLDAFNRYLSKINL